MKVLLCEDIEKLGWLGDVVEVAEGYARNYLLPQRLATPATEANIRSIADEKAKRAEQRKLEGKRLEAEMKKVEGAEAVVAAKANELGHLFGSVTAREIAANLREQGFDIADKIVQLPEHIKEVGTHPVTLKFSADLTTTVNVVVVPEKPEGAEAEEAPEAAAPAEETAAAEEA
ncbi:MAG: 50S ribosomal protein L9 [Planctomycetota bacterium]|jgi:large subunit ribosomal protein L9